MPRCYLQFINICYLPAGGPMRLFKSILGLGFLAIWLVMAVFCEAKFSNECTDYIRRAALSPTVETAVTNLQTAIDYAEKHGLTSGYTSIFLKEGDEDIGFWYQNLKASREMLREAQNYEDLSERSVVLLKLNSSLMRDDHRVVVPVGLSRFPHKWVWVITFFGALACAVIYLMYTLELI